MKAFRIGRPAGRNQGFWPAAVLLLAAVLLPTGFLLWFMNEAMRGERELVKQKLADAYRAHLGVVRDRVAVHWERRARELDETARHKSGTEAFAAIVRARLADAVLVYDANGKLLYPSAPEGGAPKAIGRSGRWEEAQQAEFGRQAYERAWSLYAAIAREAQSSDETAHALQAEARCLVKAGKKEAAAALIARDFRGSRLAGAKDPQGRVVAADVEMLALETLGSPANAPFPEIQKRLQQRLEDYANAGLGADQRRFLMRRMKERGWGEFATLEAEEMAVQALESGHLGAKRESALRRLPGPGVWQTSSESGRVTALLRDTTVQKEVKSAEAQAPALAGVRVKIAPPGETPRPADAAAIALGEKMPGWSVRLEYEAGELERAARGGRRVLYMWMGSAGVAAVLLIGAGAARWVRGQTRLARLKNDLVATVSHELKTPLSSMRLLVDTLLDTAGWDERRVREYLQLIAKENARLTRVIDNFLAFSRMERNKQAFDFHDVRAEEIVTGAVEAVRERLQSNGCRFSVEIEPDLPAIEADEDAMVTALLNLLDNAYKYTGDEKQIGLRVYRHDGTVCFAVKDNGIGLSPRDQRKVFERFWQADRRLSRSDTGVGLGLSIVEFIMRAHRGTVRLESEPGKGSAFTLVVPAEGGAAS